MSKSKFSNVHIGSHIKRRAKDLNFGQTRLGKEVVTSRQNVNSIYKKKAISTDFLFTFSRVLGFDFFALYSKELGFKKEYPPQVKLKKEIRQLKREVELQRKIIQLYETKQ